MEIRHIRPHTVRAGAAVVAAAALFAAGSWGGYTASTQAASSPTSTPRPAVTRQEIGGRDSYADIVKVVAPAVVTIRTEGKVRIAPASAPGEDLLRQFFGNGLASPGRAREF